MLGVALSTVAAEMVALTVAVCLLGVSQGSEEKAEHDGLERQHFLLLLFLLPFLLLLSKTEKKEKKRKQRNKAHMS